MNQDIIKQTAALLKIKVMQVENVLSLLEEGATVPFIARYRKEKTGGLNEDQIREISQVYEYSVNLLKRKEDVIRLIDEKGMMTAQLKADIMKAEKLSEVEDYYRPYKEKKKTRATMAKAKGLEPLAQAIMKLPRHGDLKLLATPYLNEEVPTVEDALAGASDIIAEDIADSAKYRQRAKEEILNYGKIVTKVKKNAKDEKHTYEKYYDYSESVKRIANHRVLAINRAEKEKVISVSFDYDESFILGYILRGLMGNKQTIADEFIRNATLDAYKRLIAPSIEREIRSDLTEKAEDASLQVFSVNLEHLLMQPPMKGQVVLGLDPAFRTGCKLAVMDPTGKFLAKDKVFITIPKKSYAEDEKKLLQLITRYHVSLIAIGNGTASRESEAFVAKLIKNHHLDVKYVIVSEAGASVYSASPLAKEEFPDFQVEERSAVSIGRRLQDPLAELVKIEPKAISVGQYQHDMNQKKLDGALAGVVEKCVNSVGVDLNTASAPLLSHISGITASIAKNIVAWREENGSFAERSQLLKVKGLGPRAYEQCAGFLRIRGGRNPLDNTAVHPESYSAVKTLAQLLQVPMEETALRKMKSMVPDTKAAAQRLEIGEITLKDILAELEKPGRDPRQDMPAPVLRSDVLSMEDLEPGMKLKGTVRNIVDFGAFVDIGVHQDGLVHISRMSSRFIKHPLEVVSVGDVVEVTVLAVDQKKKRISLSMV